MKVILNDFLKNKNISQYKLAQSTGIAAATLNNLCNNKTTSVSFDTLDKICEVLDCSVSDILVPEKSLNLKSLNSANNQSQTSEKNALIHKNTFNNRRIAADTGYDFKTNTDG